VPAEDTLLGYFKQKSLLLILDNCEHLVAEVAALVDALLRGCSQLRIFATSRQSLRIGGEHRYPVQPLAFPCAKAVLTVAVGRTHPAFARQQTLRAAIDWSYDLLEPAEQGLFRRLGVFAKLRADLILAKGSAESEPSPESACKTAFLVPARPS
jgi:predicted ATPase